MKHIYISFMKSMILPLLIALIVIGIFSFGVYSLSLRYSVKLNHNNNMQNIKLNATLIQKNSQMQSILLDDVLWKSNQAGQLVMDNQDELSDEYLAYVASLYDVELLYWFDNEGIQRFAANGLFNGYQIVENTALYDFWVSGLDYYEEPVRKSVNRDIYVKFVYFRNQDNHFLQVGVTADYLVELTQSYQHQTVIDNMVKQNEHILYALILDQQFLTLADSDQEDVGLRYQDDPDYMRALAGETLYYTWFYEKLGTWVYEYATPLYDQNNTIVGVLAVGYDMAIFNQTRDYLILSTVTLALLIVMTMQVLLILRVVIPIGKLNLSLSSYSIETKHFETPSKKPNYLKPTYQTIETLSNEIETYTNLLFKQATTDYLLGIPNRMAANHEVERRIKNQEPFAVLYLDIDNFKVFNDQKGHEHGDQLLKIFASHVGSLMDGQFFARYGGDEFLIIHPYQSMERLQNLVTTLSQTFNQSSKTIFKGYFSISIGISLFPKDGNTVNEIIRKANMALHHSKDNGKQGYAYFEKIYDLKLAQSLDIEKTIKDALNDDGFYLVYQPQMAIETETMVSMEALIRLKNHAYGPNVFIPVAEEKGWIEDIGRWVIDQVLKQMHAWNDQGYTLLPCHINFSAVQFLDRDIVHYINSKLKEYHIAPQLIVIEVTESALITHQSLAYQTLNRLSKMGLKIALDDFGMGVSGINYLVNMHFDYVKLDKVLADKYLNTHHVSIYQSIISLIQNMGHQLIAEGIENASQIDLLKQSGCRLVQGYYYYKPLSSSDMERLLIEVKKTTSD